ncbi:ABC transporter substrate-binding protein [Bosea caraganae]|uniref:ABC transporter substrate-binding protein n=1 Tax=Bosea caraganae TaxID=2763117 RepID=A0A370L2G3_9HYPH|nr:ABC transporter substrate-binding protein [Bosea caraganae]RDJ22425.1 ABC transporter substrate-binding protein [Bosea caraganae]RDJ30384.1 ABC transporter substrate-binding protein [Bosea caraganae]
MRRVFGAAIAALLTLGALGPASAQQQSDVTLRVASAGGPFTEAVRRNVADRFTRKTGIKVQFIDGNNPDHLAKIIASKGRTPPYDVAITDKATQDSAIANGLLLKLDPELVPHLSELVDGVRHKEGYGPQFLLVDRGIVYNAEKFKEAGIPEPTSWLDLWNPKLAGKISIPDIAQANGPGFLIQINRVVGGNETDLEKGIRKIAELKVHSYYSSTVQVEALLPTGELWAANMPNGRAWALIDKGLPLKFVVPKEGSVGNPTTIDVVGGTKYPREAQLFVDAALSPLAQLGLSYDVPYGPTNKLLEPILAADPDHSRKFPWTQDQLAKIHAPDWASYVARQNETLDLWNRLIRR